MAWQPGESWEGGDVAPQEPSHQRHLVEADDNVCQAEGSAIEVDPSYE